MLVLPLEICLGVTQEVNDAATVGTETGAQSWFFHWHSRVDSGDAYQYALAIGIQSSSPPESFGHRKPDLKPITACWVRISVN
jgi:hypothetical protein